MSKFKCSIPGCFQSGDMDPILHVWPHPTNSEARHQQWSLAIYGKINEDITPTSYKTRRVCRRHFEDKFKCRNERISRNAVPTLFLSGFQKERMTIVQRRRQQEKENTDDSKGLLFEDLMEEDSLPGHQDNEGDNSVDLLYVHDDLTEDYAMYSDEEQVKMDITIQNRKKHVADFKMHDGISCNACQQPMATPFRYTCVQCIDYDLCPSCEARSVHSGHYMLRLPESRPYVEIQSVLTVIRDALKQILPGEHTSREQKSPSTSEFPSDDEVYVIESLDDCEFVQEPNTTQEEITFLDDKNVASVDMPTDDLIDHGNFGKYTTVDEKLDDVVIKREMVELEKEFDAIETKDEGLKEEFPFRRKSGNVRTFTNTKRSKPKMLLVKVNDLNVVQGLKKQARVSIPKLDSRILNAGDAKDSEVI